MRRLTRVGGLDWLLAWVIWMVVGFVVLLIPALFVDSDRNNQVYMGTYLLVAVIVYAIPLAAGVLLGLVQAIQFVVHEYGPDLLPRRIVESAEDLRERYRG